MAIIRCPSCHQRVSSLSVQCLYCKQPIQGRVSEDGRPVRKTRSGGGWMTFFSLITTLIFIIGAAIFIRDQGTGLSLFQSPVALALMTVGVAGYLVVRVMSWSKKFR